MAYSDFTTLTKLKKTFDIKIHEQADLFANIEPVKPSDFLVKTLA